MQLAVPVIHTGAQGLLTRAALLTGASRSPCLRLAPHEPPCVPVGGAPRQAHTASASAPAGVSSALGSLTARLHSGLVATTSTDGFSSSSSCSFYHHQHRHLNTAAAVRAAAAQPSDLSHPAGQPPAAAGSSHHESASYDAISSSSSYADADDGSYEQSHEYGAESNGEEQDSQRDRDRALKRVLRSSNAAELAAVHFFSGAAAVLPRSRPDAAFFAEQEAGAAEEVRRLLPRYRVRPSLAQGPLSLASFALGAVAAAAPPNLRLAIAGAVGDALTEHYNEQLRQLNDAGAAAQAPDVRRALRSLRDLPRAPDGAPPAPDLVSVIQEGVAAATAAPAAAAAAPPPPGSEDAAQGAGGPAAAAAAAAGAAARGPTVLAGVARALRELGLEGGVGAVVKAGARVALDVAAKV
ncbi:hypothetical protein HYH02_011030 [Chlamydomonas schloesseri]|uniref:Ubiquinone biosynthesis protein n=1 Tax=Chlamydomonas schloesseri TaxID=2026947 RepID=A0A835TDG7_9CHLO|nr:hypothetical protein HYH02_011030 [Chlamydomonas schloesseri]|eukprot:KAG2438334.1 hypothetical protein HYH02_011030 [Chlamydomonas schloesseri]